ncbi:glycoside hydrolase family 26 protein [Actinosynnema sp. NPDC091369]
MFSHLRDQQGNGVLFGHQQTTEFGVTWDESTETDGLKSDVKAGVGDHPALFGWDTGHLGHGSSPGDPAPEENFRATVKLIETAHNEIGGIHTLASHMDNFVTGGSFYDTDGDVVTRILPGGDHHAQFNAYLDRVARLAHEVDDRDGNPIPMIHRPFHENSGSWFWWGAAHASPAKYVELFRYTVEYLRDVKDVHNFLYAYSPGGGYGGVDDVYMRTYPGDNYIDVFGIDSYDGSNGSQQWLDGVVADLGMIARIAQQRGKVSAFTEYGVSGALKPNGQNGNLDWFTTLFDAIKADPWANRSAFMLTWVNFGTEQFFLPPRRPPPNPSTSCCRTCAACTRTRSPCSARRWTSPTSTTARSRPRRTSRSCTSCRRRAASGSPRRPRRSARGCSTPSTRSSLHRR